MPEPARAILRRIRGVFGGEAVFVIAIAALLGLATGLGVLGFRTLVVAVSHFAFGQASPLAAAASLPWWWRLGLPAAGMLLVWPLCRWLAPEARGHGVPEVMDAVMHDGRIRGRVVLVKSLASALSIGTGGSVGREGPIVQIGPDPRARLVARPRGRARRGGHRVASARSVRPRLRDDRASTAR